MADKIWVYMETGDSQDLGLLHKAQLLAGVSGGEAAAVCMDSPDPERLYQSGADVVYDLPMEGSSFIRAEALCALCEEHRPDILLFAASVESSAVAARAAAMLHTGLTADCTGLEIENGLLRQTRPAFGGGLIADIYCPHRRPQIATVRPGIFPVPVPDMRRTGRRIAVTPPAVSPDPAELVSRVRVPVEQNVREARIVVAGGKGVGSRNGFALLHTLANRIGGVVGASRSAVDAGYAEYDCQIGQTGTTVSPDLYLAFGISGAQQHVAGMNASGKVIAVNADPKAPIFDYADLAIIGDWREVALAILSALEK